MRARFLSNHKRSSTTIPSAVLIVAPLVFLASGCAVSGEHSPGTGVSAHGSVDPSDALAQMLLDGMSTSDHQVTVRAGLAPAHLQPGQDAALVVALKIEPGWHIYAPGSAPAFAKPTRVSVDLPAAIQAAGEWQFPKPAKARAGSGFIYEESAIIRRLLHIAGDAAAGPDSLNCAVEYVACNEIMCLPPETQSLSVKFEIVK